jgi:polyisoprenoid-binding protein YceI
VVALTIAVATPAPTIAQGVLVEKSDIRFTSKQLGVNVEGHFRRWTANVVFQPSNLAASSASFDIAIGSIDLASDDSEREVKGPLWFDTAKFPVAHFASTSIKDSGSGKYEVAGTLSIKGIPKPAVIPITLSTDASGAAVVDGAFTIRRLDYKIGEGEWADTGTVANDVQVRVHLVLAPAK